MTQGSDMERKQDFLLAVLRAYRHAEVSDYETLKETILDPKNVVIKPATKLDLTVAETINDYFEAELQRSIDRAVAEKLREIVNFALPDELPAGVDTICASILINTIMERAEQQLSPTTKKEGER